MALLSHISIIGHPATITVMGELIGWVVHVTVDNIWIVESDSQGRIRLPDEVDPYPDKRYMRQDLPGGKIKLTPLPLLSSQF